MLVELREVPSQELKCLCSSARVLGQVDVGEAYKVQISVVEADSRSDLFLPVTVN